MEFLLKQQRGFTLVEISIVLVIVTLLLGALLVPLGGAFEESRRKRTRAQLEEIHEALVGFAVSKGRLPCPATGTSGSLEMPVGGGDCTAPNGFVPAATLGLIGDLNEDGLLLDVWGNPLRYSVDQSDVGGESGADFTTAGDLSRVGMSNLSPSLVVCISASTSVTCGGANNMRANQIPAIAFSMGADWNQFSSSQCSSSVDQCANVGEADGSSIAAGYPVPGNNIFVSKSYTEREGNEKFDDIVIWVSENLLYTRLIQAGVLP